MTRTQQWEHAWGLRQCQQGAAEHPSGQGSLQARTCDGTMGTTSGMLGEMLGVGPRHAAPTQLLPCQAVVSSQVKGGLRSEVTGHLLGASGAGLGSARSKTDFHMN